MHIHLKDAIYNQELFDLYVKKCIDCGIDSAVFLDHGNRISAKHKPVLCNKNSIDQFNEKIINFRKSDLSKKLMILRGIEIDYSNNLDFREDTFRILNYGKFEWVIGAIHSMVFDNYGQYLVTIIDMLNNYKIKVIAHIKKTDDYVKYDNLFREILNLCSLKNVIIEINTSDRSRWSKAQLYYMLDLMNEYNVKYVFASDAHKWEDIGYMIAETEEMVDQWKRKK